MHEYSKLIDNNTNNGIHAEAVRRFADIELDVGEANMSSTDPDVVATGELQIQAAIELYHSNLAAYPNRDWNDQILYQLARAYTLLGDTESALQNMTRLVKTYPETRYYGETQFRRAETLFVLGEYPMAAEAYDDVVNHYSTTPYYEKAIYKLGWSRFKQEEYGPALDSYITLLDLKTTQGQILEQGLAPTIARADRELLQDTLRVVSLAFSYQDSANTLQSYFVQHGARNYEPLLYRELGSLHLKKDRITDAADVYLSFVAHHPLHPLAPQLHEEAIAAYKQGNFPTLILSAKEDFVNRYGVESPFWKGQSIEIQSQVKPLLANHIKELAEHYHSTARITKKAADYQQAVTWYDTYLNSFPDISNAARMNFLLAEALYDSTDYARAVKEYEHTAYIYPQHADSAEAGYAAILTYNQLSRTQSHDELKLRAMMSGLRFSHQFPLDKHTPSVLANNSETLFSLAEYQHAGDVAKYLIDKQAGDTAIINTAWRVYGHSSFELQQYAAAEEAYSQLLKLTKASDKQYKELSERLAASIYKQGELVRDSGDTIAAIGHFMRLGTVTPSSPLRATAQYDAATLYIQAGSWLPAISLLEDFRHRFPAEKALQSGCTEKLAVAYMKSDQGQKAADEMLKLAVTLGDKEYQRSMMLQAADTYDKAKNINKAATTYKDYIALYPQPIDEVLDAQKYLADYSVTTKQPEKRQHWLREIIETDKNSGRQRTDQSQYLAATAMLELASPARDAYQKVELTVPLKRSLKNKKALMQTSIKFYQDAIKYRISDVTTAATYQLGEVYSDFARSLMASQRPSGLSPDELEQYEILLEEQAYPFEEKAIEIHQANMHLTRDGIYDQWVQKSQSVLATIQPGRYAKKEKTLSYVEAIH
jgi:tetratricopeptide (TPR) repeat protein